MRRRHPVRGCALGWLFFLALVLPSPVVYAAADDLLNALDDIRHAPPAREEPAAAPTATAPAQGATETPAYETGTICPVCGGSGYRSIAGDQVPCAVCGGTGRLGAPPGTPAKPSPEATRPDSSAPLPAPAAASQPEREPEAEPAFAPAVFPLPASGPRPPSGIDVEVAPPAPSLSDELRRKTASLMSVPVPVSGAPLAASTAVTVQTPWGEIPFCLQDVYQHELDRGPGFTAKVPKGWVIETLKHNELGGMQHRYTAPDGLTRVVAVIFPLEEAEDLADFLARKQASLFTSFKLQEARRVSLARRSGVAVHYQGILLMRDVACHLFLTQYAGKGYLIYGLYFNREGGFEVAKVMQSVRVFK